MTKFEIELTEIALEGIERLRRGGEKQALRKLNLLLSELEEHPTTGTGRPERLRGELAGKWSRRITDRHRLISEIHDEVVRVVVLGTWGHYGDK